jgi:hypothetical protein
MFVFTFDGALFRLAANTPSFDPLFQLPPRSMALASRKKQGATME